MKYLLLLLSLSTQAQHITVAQDDTSTYATFNLFIKNPCTGETTWHPFFRLIDSAGNEMSTATKLGAPVHVYPGTFTFKYWGKRTVKLGNRDNVLVLLDSHLELLHTHMHSPFKYYWCRQLANGKFEEYHENGQLRTRGKFKDGEVIRLEQWDLQGKKYKQ